MTELTEQTTQTEGRAQAAPIVYERQAALTGVFVRDFFRALVAEGVPDFVAAPLAAHWLEHVMGWGWGPEQANRGILDGVPPLWGVPTLAAMRLDTDWFEPDAAEDGRLMMRTIAATIGAFARALLPERDDDPDYILLAGQQQLIHAYYDRVVTRWRSIAAAAEQTGVSVLRDGIFAAARAERTPPVAG